MHGHGGGRELLGQRGEALSLLLRLGFLFLELFQSKHSDQQGIDKTEIAGDGMKLYNMYSRRIHLSPARVSGILAQPHASPTDTPENSADWSESWMN